MSRREKLKPTGTRFEDQVKVVCEAYAVQGRAYLEKVCPPILVKFGGHTVKLKNPFVDFTGAWTERGGKCIHLEAKSTKEPRLAVCRDHGGVTVEQFEALENWWNAGAAVGVLWEHGPEVRFVTLGMLKKAKGSDRVSVPWAEAYPIPEGKGLVSFDFLAVLHQIYPCAVS